MKKEETKNLKAQEPANEVAKTESTIIKKGGKRMTKNKDIVFEVLKSEFKDQRFYLHTYTQSQYWYSIRRPLAQIKAIQVEGGNCTAKEFFANERVVYLVVDNATPFILSKKDYTITQINKTEYQVALKKAPQISTIFSVSWKEV